jgi:hypothetical protein
MRDNITFKPASSEDLDILKQYGLPQSILDFYSKYEPNLPEDPDEMMEISIRLHCIGNIQYEVENLEPSCYLKEFGYITFASTRFGNAVLFDLNNSKNGAVPIVLASDELSYMDIEDQDTADENVTKVADSLEDFLTKVSDDSIKI